MCTVHAIVQYVYVTMYQCGVELRAQSADSVHIVHIMAIHCARVHTNIYMYHIMHSVVVFEETNFSGCNVF